jgi:hypothetical protein
MRDNIMSKTREENVKFVVNLMKKNSHIKQYKRLITSSLFPEEDFDTIYEEQMNYLIAFEEYEKCSILLKLKNNRV